jgi:hypothetical protein
MLTISAAQMQALSDATHERLVDMAVNHIRTALPETYDALGYEGVHESVLIAAQKADRYGLERWPEIVRYLDVMYILGFDFDDDPGYPWAQQVLTDTDMPPDEKMETLTAHAIDECEAAANAAGTS